MRKSFLTMTAIVGFTISASAQYTFYIGSGKFTGGGINATAYSGINYKADGWNLKNNPQQTMHSNQGAIPAGTYYIVGVNNSKGANTIVLSEDSRNDMYGRNNFRIHGDNSSNNASQGCIILNADARARIAAEFNKRTRNDAILTLFVYE
jgi:hypothetical protein